MIPPMGRLQKLVLRAGRKRWFAWVGARVAPHVDRAFARVSGGRTLARLFAPTLLLTAVGRRSGQPRTVPLLYVAYGDAYALAATNWGQAHHPAWSSNLLANPDATITIDGREQPVRARLATDAERAELWPRFTRMWPAYADYAERITTRDVRMFLLEPRETSDG